MDEIQATVIFQDSEMSVKQEMDFLRGYASGIGGGRGRSGDTSMIGDQLRENLLHPELRQLVHQQLDDGRMCSVGKKSRSSSPRV